MSVSCIGKVLDGSSHAASELLMLVVLADYSDDGGNSYPAVASLARKCRMSPRNANYVLNALQESGELRVLKNEGPKGTNRYRIMLADLGGNPLRGAAPPKAASGVQAAAPLQGAAVLQPASPTPAAGFLKPLKPAADEPSLNRQEPSGRRKPAKAPACPYLEIVAAYHEALPELPRVLVIDSKDRKKALDEFWSWLLVSAKVDGTRRIADASNAVEALDWVRRFFKRARGDDYIMGRAGRGPGHENWKPDLNYVMSDKVRTRVIEKAEVTE